MSELSAVLFCHQFRWNHPELEGLHPAIDLQLQQKAQALVGLNGSGKSLLLTALAGQAKALSFSGQLHWSEPFYYLPQQLPALDQTIAAYLGLAPLFDALDRIEAGSTDPADFDQVADRWLAKTQLCHWLADLTLPAEPELSLKALSPGQLMKLRLAYAFSTQKFLLLDEVSNHLDQSGRGWLKQQLHQYKAGYLLVSHDVGLLEQVQCIYQLSPLGLEKYQGNYQQFLQQSQHQQQLLQQQNISLKKQQQRLQQQHQYLVEQQQKKHQQAKQNKKNLNQATLLLGRKAQLAEQSCGRLQQQGLAQQQQLALKRQQIQQQLDLRQLPTLPAVAPARSCHGPLVCCEAVLMPYGSSKALSFQLGLYQRYVLRGANGSGKSTLLQLLAGLLQPKQGLVQVKQPVFYLDQQLKVLDGYLGAEQVVQQLSPLHDRSQIRSYLAAIGLDASRLTLPTEQLSGGERIKLMLLILSVQPQARFLLLDEPDNHLDFQALAMLQNFLRHYPAGFLLVSHQPELWQGLEFSASIHLD